MVTYRHQLSDARRSDGDIQGQVKRSLIKSKGFNQSSTLPGHVSWIPGNMGLMIAVFRFIVLRAVNRRPGRMGLMIAVFLNKYAYDRFAF